MPRSNILIQLLITSAILAARPAIGQQPIPPLPIDIGSAEIKPLVTHYSSELQLALSTEIRKQKRWDRLVETKKLAIGVVDLSDPLKPRFAGINENEMMYAASLPKIAILFAAMEANKQGDFELTETVRRDLRLMIAKSNNQASTRMIDKLGYERIAKALTDDRYNLYNEKIGGGLWVGKRYAKGGPVNREPLKNLSHAATAFQVCRYYYLLAYGQLVSRSSSTEMLRILESPELHHKFVNTLDRIAPLARLFRKSGSWSSFHSDSVLVWGRTRRYILVALVDDQEGEQIMRNIILSAERALNQKQ